MYKAKVTVDRKNGRLLFIYEGNQKYYLRDEDAAEAIRSISNKIEIKDISESKDLGVIKCKNGNITIDISDERMRIYKNELKPLFDKVFEFIRMKDAKNTAKQVQRKNVLSRNKVITARHNPRSSEFKNKVKGFGQELLEKIIKDNNANKKIKIGALALGSIALIGSFALLGNKFNAVKSPSVSELEPYEYYESVEINPHEEENDYGFEVGEEVTPQPIIEETTPQPIVNEFDGVTFEYTNRCDSSKAINCREKYGDQIAFYANMYGVDANLAIAIATQERGVHSSIKDNGGATGLFQIQNSVWIGHEISAYNFNTGQVDTIKVTEENIGELDSNIRFGCMILRECYEQMRGNIPATIQCYNYGYGNMVTVYRNYCIANGLENADSDELNSTRGFTETEKIVLLDQRDIGWTDSNLIKIVNRNGYTIGDPNYINHILSYIPESEYELSFMSRSGENNTLTFRNAMEYIEEGQLSR